MNPADRKHVGKVYLVGAGPGDPGLITLRGVECLARADLVLYESLVNPALLEHAPPSVEVICLGQRNPRDPQQGFSQQQIHRLMIEAARQGQSVVYLKCGDPEVFGHSGEEIEALTAAGMALEVVPGITAGLAAAGYAGIPITHAQHASAVALVTGREQRNKSGPAFDYAALADFPGTLVFYMGSASAGQWSQALIGRGKSPETPVAIVGRCSRPDQQTIRCTLATVAEVASGGVFQKSCSPAVIIVGEVAALAPESSWFAARKLFGKRVLLTRPRDQVGPMQRRLTELGADVMFQPAIRIGNPLDWEPVDAALARLDSYDWLVFSSANGVRYLLERLCRDGGDLRRLGRVKLAAIGPATAHELARYRLQTDLIPRQYRAEALAEALIRHGQNGRSNAEHSEGAKGQRFLLVRASRGREVLAERLRAAGGVVDQVVVYSSTDVTEAQPDVAEALSAGRIDWITVTSSAIARSLAALFGQQLRRSRLASISPITSGVLRELGYPPAVEAAQYTTEGVIEAVLAEKP